MFYGYTFDQLGWGNALLIALSGLVVTFMMLAILAVVIMVISRVVSTLEGKKKAAPAPAPKKAAAPAAAPAAPAVPEKDDSEIVAIVTSVICEELGAQPSELCISGIREV